MRNAIGIDLGGTSIKYALINEEGEFLYSGTLPSCADISAEAVVDQLVKAIEIVKEYAFSIDCLIAGVGVGTPGIVDESGRTVLGGAENIKGWEAIPLADMLEKRTCLTTCISNDANLMGLGETHYGAGIGASHVVFLTVGTGIGGAVVIDNKLFNGYANRGTELGHTPIVATGEPCACGSVGCLEHYASTSALVRNFINRCPADAPIGKEPINGERIIQLYKEGNSVAKASLEEHCFYLGRGIAGFINIFSPQRVIIGGGLSEAGEFYIDMLRKQAFKYAMSDCSLNTSIMAATLGNRAGSMGAAWMVFNSGK